MENLLPKLRFPGFEGEWQQKTFSKLLIQGKLGGNYENSESNEGIPIIKMGNLGRGEININKVQYLPQNSDYNQDDILHNGDLLFNTRNTLELVGKVSIWRNELPIALYNSNLMRMKFNSEIDSSNQFMNYYFNIKSSIYQLRRFATGTTSVAAIYGKDLKSFFIIFPTLPEQTKIATFLTEVDKKLTALKQKKNLLEQYKKGIMQQIFSQELRFKDDNGNDFPDWEEKMLGDVAEKRIIKNKDDKINLVFTNSAVQGIVNQRDFFDKDIANKNNLTGYYIVEKNDFIYNPRISSTAPVGPISRNHLDTGIMSPLYSVFRFKSGNLDFFEKFFMSSIWYKHMEDISNYGARDDRMSFSTNAFYKMPIPFPSLKEQTKIANFLSTIDEKINHCQRQIEKTEVWKKGLLQQLFV
jgi:type I restriction enzyme S subunit